MSNDSSVALTLPDCMLNDIHEALLLFKADVGTIREAVYREGGLVNGSGSGELADGGSGAELALFASSAQVTVQIIAAVAICLSLLCMALGWKLLRPCIAIVAFFVGSAAAVEVFYQTQLDLQCDIQLGVVLLAGLVLGALFAALVRVAYFFLGLAIGVAAMLLLANLIPFLRTEDVIPGVSMPLVLGYTLLPFWTAALALGVVLGVVCRKRHKDMTVMITAVLGAYGFIFGTRLASQGAWGESVYFGIFVVSAFVSVLLQLDLRRGGRWVRCKPCRESSASPLTKRATPMLQQLPAGAVPPQHMWLRA